MTRIQSAPYETLLTVREVAQQLRVDEATVRRWAKQGVLKAVVLPHSGARKSYRIKQSTLLALFVTASPSSHSSN